MKQVEFSIIIPCLNEEKFLPNLLESIKKQTYKNFEVIVVDGNSSDQTVKAAKNFQKHYLLRVYVNNTKGVSCQRNFGAKKAVGKWMLFVDADSILLPYCLERITEFTKTHHADIFTAWYKPDTFGTGESIFSLIGNMFIEGTLLMRRPMAPGPFIGVRPTFYFEVNGFDESMSFGEDFDFTSKIVKHGGKAQVIPGTLYVFSTRRIKRDGKFKFVQTYALASFLTFITNKALGKFPGYILGGQIYNSTTDKSNENKLKKLLRQLTEMMNKPILS